MRALATVALAAVASLACRSQSTKTPPDSPADRVSNQGADVSTDDELPNARIRLRLHFSAPSVGERDIEQTIWLRGSKFHVRDEAGRDVFEILGDVTWPRGLGLPATTIEEMMDRRDAARRKPSGVTEIYGDLASDTGFVIPAVGKAYAREARELAPIARQVLAGDRTAGLTRSGEVSRLARSATEYKGDVEVEENGAKRRNTVVRVVAPPYLLLDDVRNAELTATHYYVREIVALDEGVVTDADLAPPSP
jgi:hypothetical protein